MKPVVNADSCFVNELPEHPGAAVTAENLDSNFDGLVDLNSLDDFDDIDLRDEELLHAMLDAEFDVERVRAALYAINLQTTVGALEPGSSVVFDLAVYRSTGSRRLAAMFGPVRDGIAAS